MALFGKPTLDLSKLDPKVCKLFRKGMACSSRNDARGYLDLMLKCFLITAAPSNPWAYGRFYFLEAYASTLCMYLHLMKDSDKKAFKDLCANDKEPALYRALAAYALGCGLLNVLDDLDGEGKADHFRYREEKADYFRFVLEILGDSMPVEDANRPIIIHESALVYMEDDTNINSTVGEQANRLVRQAKKLLHSAIHDDLRGLLPRGFDPSISHLLYKPNDRMGPAVAAKLPPEIRQRLEMGGNACDCCGKTLEQLGVCRLMCCSKCKKAYYCGPDCQRKQWKAGHKNACRKPGEIKPMDWMRIHGLQSKTELNQCVAMVERVDPAKPKDRWIVRVYTATEEKEVSVASTKLDHIRPAK